MEICGTDTGISYGSFAKARSDVSRRLLSDWRGWTGSVHVVISNGGTLQQSSGM